MVARENDTGMEGGRAGNMLDTERARAKKRMKKGQTGLEGLYKATQEEDPLLLSRRGSRLAICVTSEADLSELFERLEQVQLDDVNQDIAPSKPRKVLDVSPAKSFEFSDSNYSMDFFLSNSMNFSPNKSILKSSRERSRRKSVKFHFADEQTTV